MMRLFPTHLLAAVAASILVGLAAMDDANAARLVIATVNNEQMRQLQELSPEFEKAYPEVELKWVTLEENALRRYVAGDMSTRAGQFDVVTIGLYEAALWPARGWLKPVKTGPGYEVNDLLPNIRQALSYRGTLYGAPLYGESSMLMYRKDLMRRAGLTMPAAPTWNDIARFAARLNDPSRGTHGICLRANPGWGANMALVSTMANTFGGQWFDTDWRPRLDSKAWRAAVGLYVSLLQKYGPSDPLAKGFNENLRLFQAGNCALWVDASVAAGSLASPGSSRVAGNVGFAPAPIALTEKGSRWLWSWALAIPAGIDPEHEAAAQAFVSWATSRDYIQLVASRKGWQMIPSGTRTSTYANPQFRRAAPWSEHELAAIRAADMHDATLAPSPYAGIQFVAIPGFHLIGDEVGRNIGEAVAGRISVDEALQRSQRFTEQRAFFE